LDKSRLIKFLGDVGEEYMRAIEEAVKIHLDLT
jgi:mRNA-degrading endonuclease toxin of MazEF toxin-antitoxin module